jgi:phosphohistidine phosphatase
VDIYLFRHGHAAPAASGCPDQEHSLSERGRAEIAAVLGRAEAAGILPGVILSSPYRRAMETAAIAEETLGSRGGIVPLHALVPTGTPQTVWDELRNHHDPAGMLVVGHDPLMSTLVAFLLSAPALRVELETATLVAIHFESLNPEPRGILKWMITPKVAS